MKGTVLVTGASGFHRTQPRRRACRRGLCRQGGSARSRSRPAGSWRHSGSRLPDLARPVDWSAATRRREPRGSSRRARALAGRARRRCLSAHQRACRRRACGSGEPRQGRASRLRLVRQGAGRALGRPCDHRDGRARADRRLWPLKARSRAADRRRAVSGFTVLRPAVVYGPGVKGNIASLATLAKTPMPLPFARSRQSPLLARARKSHRGDPARAAVRARGERNLPRRRCRADQRGRTWSPPCARGLGRPPLLVGVPQGAVKRLMRTFGREAEWERISGSFVIDAC